LRTGQVVAVFGKHFWVQTDDGLVECVSRGRKGGIACGDRIEFKATSKGAGVIERVLERHNLLYRSDAFKTKLLAANLDQALIVTAAEPAFNEELLNRCLVACEAAGIPARIVVNKADLPQTAALIDQLRPYAALGYPVLAVSAKTDVAPLLPLIEGKTSVLVGPSGVGKSTLLNTLVPEADARTAEISRALSTGRHTTTHTRLFDLPGGGALIDSPGMQAFALAHVDLAGLQAAFPELRRLAGRCRFYNCRHLKEPDCAVQAACDAGEILPARLRAYRNLAQEILALAATK